MSNDIIAAEIRKHLPGKHNQALHAGRQLVDWAKQNPKEALLAAGAVAGIAATGAQIASQVDRTISKKIREYKEAKLDEHVRTTIANNALVKEMLKVTPVSLQHEDWIRRATAHTKTVERVQHTKNLQRKDVAAFHKQSQQLIKEGRKFIVQKAYLDSYTVEIR